MFVLERFSFPLLSALRSLVVASREVLSFLVTPAIARNSLLYSSGYWSMYSDSFVEREWTNLWMQKARWLFHAWVWRQWSCILTKSFEQGNCIVRLELNRNLEEISHGSYKVYMFGVHIYWKSRESAKHMNRRCVLIFYMKEKYIFFKNEILKLRRGQMLGVTRVNDGQIITQGGTIFILLRNNFFITRTITIIPATNPTRLHMWVSLLSRF